MTEDQINRLKALGELLSNGTISKNEFDILKSAILNDNSSELIEPNKEDLNPKNIEETKVKYKINKKLVVFGIILSGIALLSIHFWQSDFFKTKGIIKNDLSFFELKGNVKYCIETYSDYDHKHIVGFNQDGFLMYSRTGDNEMTIIQRDDDNKEIIRQDYSVTGDVGDVYLEGRKNSFTYNNKKQIESVKTEFTTYDISNGYSNKSFKYDEKGNVIEVITKDSNAEKLEKTNYTLKYDENDSIIEKIDHSTGLKSTYAFNENGWLIEKKEIDENGKLGICEQYKYDETGNKTEETYFYEGVKKSITRYKYDDSNNLILEEENWQNSGWKKKVEYENDIEGNWIKKTNFNEDGEASYTYRKIEYYSDDELKSKNEFDFIEKFGDSPLNNNENEEMPNSNSSSSYGEIRGRIIGGNIRILENEIGSPTYSDVATIFIENTFGTSLPLGLFDLCLTYEVYVYENYFGDGQNLLVTISDGKVTNVIPQNDVKDVKDICCCK